MFLESKIGKYVPDLICSRFTFSYTKRGDFSSRGFTIQGAGTSFQILVNISGPEGWVRTQDKRHRQHLTQPFALSACLGIASACERLKPFCLSANTRAIRRCRKHVELIQPCDMINRLTRSDIDAGSQVFFFSCFFQKQSRCD